MEKKVRMAQCWLGLLKALQISHYKTSASFNLRNRILGGCVVIFSVSVGTAVFSDLAKHDDDLVRNIIGLVSVIAAVLSSLQTSLKYEERAEKHRSSAVRYGHLRRELEQFIAVMPQQEPEIVQELTDFRHRWDAAAEEAPTLPQRIHGKVIKALKKREDAKLEHKKDARLS